MTFRNGLNIYNMYLCLVVIRIQFFYTQTL